MTIVGHSRQKVFFEKALSPAVLNPFFNVDSAKLPGRRAGHSHKRGTVLGPVSSRKLQQVLFKLLRACGESFADLIDLNENALSFLASEGQ